MKQALALAWRTFADARVRAVSFALLFAGASFVNAVGYRSSYPTVEERLRFALAFGANKATRLFYGTPVRLDTVGGYVSWRAGGVLSLFAAFFGALSAVRALRGEEDAGRHELVVAGAIGKGAAFTSRLAAIGAMALVLWLGLLAGLVAGGLPLRGSVFMALSVMTVASVYAGVGAVTSQVMPTRLGALEIAGAFLAVDFLVRVVADTTDRQELHWVTPLGWVEELRSFTGPRPAVLVLPFLVTGAMLVVAFLLERRRDVGLALLAPRDERGPRVRLLGSPVLVALRLGWVGFAAWMFATTGFAFVVGTISKSVASGLSAEIRTRLEQLGIELATPSGYIGLAFLFFVLALSLFCCGQLAAVRADEAEGRLETLFAQPRGRVRWLAGRLGLASAGAVLLAVSAGLGAALGATAVGADVSVMRLLGAGLNLLPATMLFLGVGALLFAAVPRLGVGIAYGLVSVAFVWELFGTVLGAPSWLLGLSPFHQIGLVPAQAFRPAAAAAMLAIGIAAAGAALWRFRGRDLVGA